MAAAIAAADAERAGRGPGGRRAGRRSSVDGEPVEVLPDEVIVSERPREGWSVVNEQGETVALDLELTPELRRAGLAREVVRLIQEARKTSGLRGLRPDRAELGSARPDGTGELARGDRASTAT